MTTAGTVVAADGTELYVESRGSGEPVLLIQGLGYATWAWSPQVEALHDRWNLVAFDNRGAGRSDKPAGPYSIEMLADDAHAVIAGTGIATAHVVGASMGGYIAQTLAARHPEAVRSLVLVATSSGGPGSLGVPDETLAAWQASAGEPPPVFARRTMPYSFSPGWTDAHPEEFERLLAARLRFPTPPEAWRAQFDACERFLHDGLAATRLDAPTMVLHGTADRVVPVGNAAVLMQRLADGRLQLLDGAGHLCWLERPARVSELLAEFFGSVDGQPR